MEPKPGVEIIYDNKTNGLKVRKSKISQLTEEALDKIKENTLNTMLKEISNFFTKCSKDGRNEYYVTIFFKSDITKIDFYNRRSAFNSVKEKFKEKMFDDYGIWITDIYELPDNKKLHIKCHAKWTNCKEIDMYENKMSYKDVMDANAKKTNCCIM